MRWAYNLGVRCYGAALQLAAPFNPKARLWCDGRKNWREKLQNQIAPGEWVWFHAASLGEYESARPVMEAYKKAQPHHKILVTFFSPSGYELKKNDRLADATAYLPLDGPSTSRDFVAITQPKLAVFVRYEFWLHYMDALQEKQIPHFIISATFRPDQFVMGRWAGFIRKRMHKLYQILVQDENSLQLLLDNGFKNVSRAGDTRVDRVVDIAQQPADFPLVKAFQQDAPLFVAGSSWQPDEACFLPFLQRFPDMKLLIAPHVIDPSNLARLEQTLPPGTFVRWSMAQQETVGQYRILIVDNIGNLSRLYRFGRYAFVGGGFTTGIHNILEAAVYKIPVFYGPHHKAFPEGAALDQLGAGFCVHEVEEFLIDLQLLESNPELYQNAQNAAADYIQKNTGATEKIMQWLLDVAPKS
jgi:3-deoxy-D-manno-octulosonic-acid transferase